MNGRFGRDNVDDFIAGEMTNIEGGGENKPTMRPQMSGTGQKSVSSKPNFGFSAGKKAGGAFAKPTFSMVGGAGAKVKLGGSSAAGPPMSLSKAGPGIGGGPPKITLKKKRQDDDFIEQEMA